MKLALVDLSVSESLPPLGIAYIAGYLKQNLSFENTIIINKNERIFDRIQHEKPDVVGFTVYSHQFTEANLLAETIKKELDKPPLLMIGGPHISCLPNSLGEFDIGVIGEGERTVSELVESEFIDYEKIDGLCYRRRNKIIQTNLRDLIEDLDTIPFPARDLLDMDQYIKPRRLTWAISRVRRTTHMMTSRGCPFNCNFCGSKAFWKSTRYNSPKYIVAEMKKLVDSYNIEAISILDDLFAINKNRLRRINELVHEERLDKRIDFICQGRVDILDAEICDLLKEIGCVGISFGFESGSNRILRYLKNPPTTVEQSERAIKLCKARDLEVSGSVMIGTPTETLEDLQQTLRFIRRNPIDNLYVYITTPFPGTKLWNYSLDQELVSENMDFGKLTIEISKNLENNTYLNNSTIKKEKFLKYIEVFSKEIDRINLSHLNISFSSFFSFDLMKRAWRRRKDVLSYLKYRIRS